jgi:hypothetical protein
MKKTRVVLSFPPSNVEEPVTYRLIKDYDLVVNILRASIDPGKQGRMVVELSGEESHPSLKKSSTLKNAAQAVPPACLFARQGRWMWIGRAGRCPTIPRSAWSASPVWMCASTRPLK